MPPVTVTGIHIKEQSPTSASFNVGYSNGYVDCFRTYGGPVLERLIAKFPDAVVTWREQAEAITAS